MGGKSKKEAKNRSGSPLLFIWGLFQKQVLQGNDFVSHVHPFADVIHIGNGADFEVVCNAKRILSRCRKPKFPSLFLQGLQMLYHLVILDRQFYTAVHKEDVARSVVALCQGVEEHGHQRSAQLFGAVADEVFTNEQCPVFGFAVSSQQAADAPSPVKET